MTDSSSEPVPLREHIEAVLNEQRRGLVVAEQEREKAARALRTELSRSIEEGDERLREHIDQQFMQIKAALESAEKLEVERIAKVQAELQAVANAIRIAAEASEKAISKAEMASEKRFEGVNEFRQQLGDQAAEFMRRDVADAQFSELRRGISELSDKLSKLV